VGAARSGPRWLTDGSVVYFAADLRRAREGRAGLPDDFWTKIAAGTENPLSSMETWPAILAVGQNAATPLAR
jgi:hypothetical protein